MSAQPPAMPPLTVEMPVKPAFRSREAWLFGLSGILAAVLAAISDLPPEVFLVVPWAPALVKLLIGISAVLGLLARLSRPDIASGVPWLDKSTIRSVMAFPKTDPEKPVTSPKAGA